jgi:hypothetical protein
MARKREIIAEQNRAFAARIPTRCQMCEKELSCYLDVVTRFYELWCVSCATRQVIIGESLVAENRILIWLMKNLQRLAARPAREEGE